MRLKVIPLEPKERALRRPPQEVSHDFNISSRGVIIWQKFDERAVIIDFDDVILENNAIEFVH